MFVPFARRAPTGDLDTCRRQIAIGSRIYVPKLSLSPKVLVLQHVRSQNVRSQEVMTD